MFMRKLPCSFSQVHTCPVPALADAADPPAGRPYDVATAPPPPLGDSLSVAKGLSVSDGSPMCTVYMCAQAQPIRSIQTPSGGMAVFGRTGLHWYSKSEERVKYQRAQKNWALNPPIALPGPPCPHYPNTNFLTRIGAESSEGFVLVLGDAGLFWRPNSFGRTLQQNY